MANLAIKDASGATKYLKEAGAGTNEDPHVAEHTVSGTVTVAGTVTASGPLTDTELRASAVAVSGTVTAAGPLTDTELRAAAVSVSVSALPALVSIAVTPALTVAGYVAGNCLGGKVTLTNAVQVSGGSGVLHSVLVRDAGNQLPPLDIFIFESDPTAATLNNRAALVFSTDWAKVIRHVQVLAGHYAVVDSKAIADVPLTGKDLKASGSRHLYAAIALATGAANWSPASVADIDVIFNIYPD